MVPYLVHLALRQFRTTAIRQACAGPYGQHCGCLVHQPAGRSTIAPHVTACPPSPPLESHAAQIAARCPHSRGAQSFSRCALATAHVPWRMASPSRDDPADLESIRGSSGRPVCAPQVLLLPAVFSLTEGPLGTDALAHSWPWTLASMRFPLVCLLAQTLCMIREGKEQVPRTHSPRDSFFFLLRRHRRCTI